MSTNPRLIRTVYRAMLRASRRGQHPQVFGEYATLAVPRDAPLPSDAKQVCTLLKRAFQNPMNDRIDMFGALRRCNELSSILQPEHLSPVLPIFNFNSTALMGEELDFNFFEPRYKLLAKQAMEEHNGMFILRARISPASENSESDLSILLKIVQHAELPSGGMTTQKGGNILVQCLCGPRVKVLDQEEVDVNVEDAPPLIRATKFVLERDDNNQEDGPHVVTELMALRSYSLELLQKFRPNRDVFLSAGLPPLDPEEYSFWALRFVLKENDSFSRITWLSLRSTQERLIFIINMLEEDFHRVRRDNKSRPEDKEASTDSSKM